MDVDVVVMDVDVDTADVKQCMAILNLPKELHLALPLWNVDNPVGARLLQQFKTNAKQAPRQLMKMLFL